MLTTNYILFDQNISIAQSEIIEMIKTRYTSTFSELLKLLHESLKLHIIINTSIRVQSDHSLVLLKNDYL